MQIFDRILQSILRIIYETLHWIPIKYFLPISSFSSVLHDIIELIISNVDDRTWNWICINSIMISYSMIIRVVVWIRNTIIVVNDFIIPSLRIVSIGCDLFGILSLFNRNILDIQLEILVIVIIVLITFMRVVLRCYILLLSLWILLRVLITYVNFGIGVLRGGRFKALKRIAVRKIVDGDIAIEREVVVGKVAVGEIADNRVLLNLLSHHFQWIFALALRLLNCLLNLKTLNFLTIEFFVWSGLSDFSFCD